MPTAKAPIAVMSFNRPQYLEMVLDSIRCQRDLNGRDVFLFQDGSFSPTMQKQHADPGLIEKSIDLFRARFPESNIFSSSTNLGVALNFDRAERHVFETLGCPAAIFCEDDLVLGPSYLTVLDRLLEEAMSDERLGYVAAFGNYKSSVEEQRENAAKFLPLHLLWGFGLTRRHWLKCRPYVTQYLEIVKDVDYRQRDHDKIRELCRRWGVRPGDTAQDRVKSFITALVGATKINTQAAYAKYIGQVGLNFTPEMFAKWGFEGNKFFEDPITLDFDFSSVNFDPWFEGNNVWKIEDSGPPSFTILAKRLFGGSPYDDFTPVSKELDLQNWNSTHPALSRLVTAHKPQIIIDLGVWKGLSTITLANAQKAVVPNGYVIAIDTFLGSPEHWNRERTDVHASLKFENGRPNFYRTFLSNMVLSGLQSNVLPLVQTSDNAAHILSRNNVKPDLVHVDAAHEYGSALRDIETYYDLLNSGGVLIGDDFNWPGVARAVVNFTDRRNLPFQIDHPKWWIVKP